MSLSPGQGAKRHRAAGRRRWAAFEFKVSDDKAAKGAESLSRLRAKLCSNARAQTREPEFMAVITGNGEYARKAEDGIYVIPLRALTW